ncbi:hypothetical protein [Streptomyces aurantiogriseus]|uniref:Uncharacterized protein n=1 Tax=Streptomyces aurantiogriseus TaxID=66870 RepID=A0A918BUD4_9ACTN|nr:hypothetical protein [Streptomyces aurantiogriseus]GGQ90711.1 hypothetical protein GCM10010251_01170 [Streptomyces aurantiogriseus]
MTPGTTTLIGAVDIGTPVLPPWIAAPAAIAVLLLVAALSVAWRRRRRKPGAERLRDTAAIPIAAVAAIGCTAYSADTSWRFAADYLDMGGTVERAAMFAAAELALFATALLARTNLNGPKQAPGLPGTLTWVITGVQIVPAYAESGLVGGTVRAFVGPVLAAMLWHLAMGIELRNRSPHADSRSLAAVLARQIRERLLARLGIADRDADAARIIRERALDRAVTLILRAEAMKPEKRTKWRGRRLTRRLHQALEQADVDRDERQDELLLRKLATRQQALALAAITLPTRWPAPTAGTLADATLARPQSTGAGRADKPSRQVRQERPDGATAAPSARADVLEPGAKTAIAPPPLTKANPKPGGRKTTVPDEVLWAMARAIGAELGTVPRTTLEDKVRAQGYTIQKDRAKEVATAATAELESANNTATAR